MLWNHNHPLLRSLTLFFAILTGGVINKVESIHHDYKEIVLDKHRVHDEHLQLIVAAPYEYATDIIYNEKRLVPIEILPCPRNSLYNTTKSIGGVNIIYTCCKAPPGSKFLEDCRGYATRQPELLMPKYKNCVKGLDFMPDWNYCVGFQCRCQQCLLVCPSKRHHFTLPCTPTQNSVCDCKYNFFEDAPQHCLHCSKCVEQNIRHASHKNYKNCREKCRGYFRRKENPFILGRAAVVEDDYVEDESIKEVQNLETKTDAGNLSSSTTIDSFSFYRKPNRDRSVEEPDNGRSWAIAAAVIFVFLALILAAYIRWRVVRRQEEYRKIAAQETDTNRQARPPSRTEVETPPSRPNSTDVPQVVPGTSQKEDEGEKLAAEVEKLLKEEADARNAEETITDKDNLDEKMNDIQYDQLPYEVQNSIKYKVVQGLGTFGKNFFMKMMRDFSGDYVDAVVGRVEKVSAQHNFTTYEENKQYFTRSKNQLGPLFTVGRILDVLRKLDMQDDLAEQVYGEVHTFLSTGDAGK